MLEESTVNDLIKRFRECKTAAEERKFINKERGEIRLHMKEWGLEQKADAILRLIWINMMGYETNFAQVECMNALFFEDFRIKLIGYLGLTLFLSEKSEVLMMATNRIRIDLENQDNFFTIALALKTFSEIADKNMTVDLFQNIQNLIKNDAKYIKKKAILSCIRVLQKEPSLVTELKSILPHMLNETNHGLLISCLQLAKQIIKIKPEYKQIFEDSLENLYDVLKTLQNEYQSQYQIDKINDPFLQTYILDFAKDIVIANPSLSGEYEAQILMVYNNIKDDASTPTLCLLYECARCIMQINSSLSLKKVGIQILGKFLEIKHSNNLYLSLKMLYYASAKYKDEIKCVKNKDFQIKRLAIMILKNISNKENVEKIFQQIFKQYKKEKDLKQSKELFTILIQIIEKHPISLQWYIQKVLQLVQYSISQVYDQDLFNYFDLISNHQELQQVFMYKSILLLSKPENWTNESLIKSICWVIGEFAELLESNQNKFGLDVSKMISIFQRLDISEFENITAFYLFVCLAKIYVKIEDQSIQDQVLKCFEKFSQNCNSIQLLKIYQYLYLLKEDRDVLEEIFEPVPPASINEIFQDIQLEQINEQELKEITQLFNKASFEVKKTIKNQSQLYKSFELQQEVQEEQQIDKEVNFLDLDLDQDNNTNQEQQNQIDNNQVEIDFLDHDDQPQEEPQQQQTDDINLLDHDDEQDNNVTQDQQIQQQNQNEDIDFFQDEQIDQNESNKDLKKQDTTEDLVDLNISNPPPQSDPYAFLNQNNVNQNNLNELNLDNDEDDEFVEQDEIQIEQLPKIKFFENVDLYLEYTTKKISTFQNQIKIYFVNKQLTTIIDLNLKIAVKKNFKILSNFLNQQMLQPNVDGNVFQDILIENSKGLQEMAMKLKLSYKRDGIVINESIMLQKVNLN